MLVIEKAGTLGTAAPRTPESKSSGSRYRARIIEAGQGSSAFYPEQVLEDYASVFQSGTQVYIDHPTASEDEQRPERSVRDLVGKFVSEAEYSEGALFADIEFYSWAAPIVEELKEDIGLSIRAYGTAVQESGNPTPTLQSFTAVSSVDLVTRAGAGGKLVQMFESARPIEDTEPDVPLKETTRTPKETVMNEAQEAMLTALVKSVEALAEQITPIAESLTAKPVEVEPVVEAETVEIDPLEAAKALAASELSEAGREAALARVSESVTLAEAIVAQREYEDAIAKAAGGGKVVVEESAKPARISWTKAGN